MTNPETPANRMTEDRKYVPQQPPRKPRRASRSVYVIDHTANVVIRVGGLFVVFAVLGLVVFMFSQVVPLFGSSEQGQIETKIAPMAGRTLYVGTDEYRRVGVRVSESPEIEFFSTLNGETLRKVPVPGLKGKKITSASVTLRPYLHDVVGAAKDVPFFGIALGTQDGHIVAGKLYYLTTYKRFDVGQEPKELAELRMPAGSEFKQASYVPAVAVVEDRKQKWVAEHMPEFGFYRYMRAEVQFNRTVDMPLNGESVEQLHIAVEHAKPGAELDTLTGVITGKGRALIRLEKLVPNPMDDDEIVPELLHEAELQDNIGQRPRHVLVHEGLREALFGTADGSLHVFRTYVDENTGKRDYFLPAYPGISLLGFNPDRGEEWRDTAVAMRDDDMKPEGRLELTAMGWLLGDSTLLVGDSLGGIQAWSPVREFNEDTNARYRRIRALPSGSGAISGFSAGQGTKSFLAWDASGRIRGIYNTSERAFFDGRLEGALPAYCYFGPKADGALAVDDKGRMHQWWMDLKHAEVSAKSLFGKVFYEGYMAPRYEWQSHAGTDDVEQKYSLMPLVIGSIKGGLYALLFALPLAVLGAVYTSEFMQPKLRSIVKPSMEVMASLPSVVLGFLGALYFAPEAAPRMPTLVVFALVTPALFMLVGWIFGQLPPYVTKRFTPWVTTLALATVLVAGGLLASVLGPRLETQIFPAVEGANPALVDSKSFKPLTEADQKAYSAGNFRSWTDGGRELPRAMANAQGTELPQGWWIPGGHALFAMLMIAPFALLSGLLLKFGHALLFGGTVMRRQFAGFTGRPSPILKLREAAAGRSAGMRPVLVDVSCALGFAGLAFGLGLLLSLGISPILEALLFSYDHPTAGRVADFRRWVTGPEGWKFNQTNSLIVGFAMGFAVIPIIYSIAEDALSSVPNQMRAASLACGASRWQTAMKVVVPAAASGIFSAIVIGLGRALGETMIVVMAAGGTPLTELQPLSGFRSLSAAIAIEMPEAPHGSTHYRTLFLGGLILFLMTFVISTMAEFVRMRLRKKLSRM